MAAACPSPTRNRSNHYRGRCAISTAVEQMKINYRQRKAIGKLLHLYDNIAVRGCATLKQYNNFVSQTLSVYDSVQRGSD